MKKDWLDKGMKDKMAGHASDLNLGEAWNELELLRNKRDDRRYIIPFILLAGIAFSFIYVKNNALHHISADQEQQHIEIANYEVKQNKLNTDLSNSQALINEQNEIISKNNLSNHKNQTSSTSIKSEINSEETKTRKDITAEELNTAKEIEEKSIVQKNTPLISENIDISQTTKTEINSSKLNTGTELKNTEPASSISSDLENLNRALISPLDPIPSANMDLLIFSTQEINTKTNILEEELNRAYRGTNLQPDSWIKITGTAGKPSMDISNRTDQDVSYNRAQEEILENIGLELSYRKYMGNHFFLEGGLGISQLSSKRQESYTSNYTEIKDDGVVAIIINTDGSQTEVLGEVEQTVTESRNLTTFNTHRNVAAQLLAGYEFGSTSRLSLALSGGLSYNLISKKNGTSLTPVSPEQYADLNSLPYRETGPLTVIFRPELNYLLQRNISISAGFQFTSDIGSWTTKDALFSQKYAGFGGHVGLRVGIR